MNRFIITALKAMTQRSRFVAVICTLWLCFCGQSQKLSAQIGEFDTLMIACDSVRFRMGIPAQPGLSYSWSPSINLSHPDSNYTMAVLENNTNSEFIILQYQVVGVDSQGNIQSQRNHIIYVYKIFAFEAVLGNFSICQNDTLELPFPAEIVGPVTVTPSSSAVITNEQTVKFFPTDTTQYVLSFIDSLFCGKVDYRLRVDVRTFLSAEILTPPQRLCKTETGIDTLQIEVIPPGGLLFGAGVVANNVFSAQTAGFGVHELVYYSFNNNCPTTDTLLLEVVGPAALALTGPPNLCQNDTLIELNFGIPAGGDYLIDGEALEVLNPSLLSAGAHTMLYRINWDTLCTFERERVFFVIPLPPKPVLSSSDPDFLACEGDTIRVSTTTFPNYGWSNGFSGPEQVFDTSASDLFVWFRSNIGCYSYSDTVNLEFSPPGELSLNALQYNNGFEISGFGNADGVINWELNGGFAPFTVAIEPDEGVLGDGFIGQLPFGPYRVTLSDSAGCQLSDSLFLRQPDFVPEPEGPEGPLLPNSFTPNGDGFNDAYVIRGLDPKYLENQLLVFDIRRQLVFSAPNYSNSWTGLSNSGERLPAGNYFLVFTSPALSEPITRTVYLKYE